MWGSSQPSNTLSSSITEEKGSCHKRFRTIAQAEAVIEDWKETYTEILQMMIGGSGTRVKGPYSVMVNMIGKVVMIRTGLRCDQCSKEDCDSI
jgi:hypothetical protein